MTQKIPLSSVRKANGFLFLSGVLPRADDGSVPEGITEQTDMVLNKITATLREHGAGLQDVVQVLVHLTDESEFAAFNQVYAQHFSEPYPVRTTVIARLAVPGPRIEVTVTAALAA